MKHKTSFKIKSVDIETLNEINNNKIQEIVRKSISFVNECNLIQEQEINNLLDLAEENGWYPFVTYVMENVEYEPPILSSYDEMIFNILMLEHEQAFFENTNEDTKNTIIHKIKELKKYL